MPRPRLAPARRGTAGAEGGEKLRGEVVGGGGHGQVQVTAFQPLHLTDRQCSLLQLLVYLLGVSPQLSARIGQADVFARLLEQRQADACLHLLDLYGYGRLRQVQFLGSLRISLFRGHGLEDT